MSKPYVLHQGDCLEILRELPDCSVDSVVCDPPYGLSKEPDMAEVLRHWMAGDDYQHKGGGFMGKTWDSFVPGPAVWKECLRVLKPGGHLLAFFGSRTYDMGTLAIRLAGFQIRDMGGWLFGSGFPKSHNLEGDWEGWGSALKPAHEPVAFARKPFSGTLAANVLAHGTGALNIDGCRVGTETRTNASKPRADRNGFVDGFVDGTQSKVHDHGRWPANLIHDGDAAADMLGDASRFFYCAKASKRDRNEGCEHIEAAHTDEQNKLHGAIEYRNICPSCERVLKNSVRECCGVVPERIPSERATRQNSHPTVKPTDLMAYLCRLVTPPGGVVLDPFMGSGSTGKAAMREGFRFIGCELSPEYLTIARVRITHQLEAEIMRTIYCTPFDDETKQSTGPSTDSGFTSIAEVLESMGCEFLSCSDRAVVYPGLMFSDYVLRVES